MRLEFAERKVCLELGWSWDRWCRTPRGERLKWLAHHMLAGEIEEYSIYSEQFKQMGLSIHEWTQLDSDRKALKKQQARKRQQMNAKGQAR